MNKNDWLAVGLGVFVAVLFAVLGLTTKGSTQEDIISKLNNGKSIECADVEYENYGVGKINEVIYILAEGNDSFETYKIEDCK